MSVLDTHILNNFLKQGAFLSVNEEEYLISWGELTYDAKHIQSGPSYYLSEFFEETGHCISFKENLLVEKKRWQQELEKLQVKKPPARQWQEPQKAEFAEYFEKFRADFQCGEIKKVVPVVFAESSGKLSDFEKINTLKKLLQLPPEMYAYGFWQSDRGFIGATPELLLDRKDKRLKTMALAGTGAKDSESLLENHKEREEHQFVISDLQKKLKDCNLTWEPTQEWEVGNLKHLRTFAVGTSSQSWVDLIKKLHPTSALGGTPNPLPMSYLAQYCNSQIRKFFGAPFGLSYLDRDLVVVALRNVQWFDEKSYLGSGCGLVAESDLDKEWQELKLKRSFTKEFLNL